MPVLSGLLLTVCGCSAPSQSPWSTMSVTGHLPDLRFSLMNDLGKPVTAADFRGNRGLLYFGYTGCGLQCPLTLARLVQLSKDEPDVRVVFVTVTPALDRPQILHAYLGQFATGLTGLTGPTNNVEALARRYRAAFPAGSGPNLPHSNIVYVFDKTGRARLLIRPEDSDQAIRHDLRLLE